MLTTLLLLTGLALIDSLSIGTFYVPLWLMLTPGRPNGTPVLVYLVSIALAYFVIGIALLAGAGAVLDALGSAFARGGALDRPAINLLIMATGLVLVTACFRKSKLKQSPSRIAQWRERAMTATSGRSIAVLAVITAGLEGVTLAPYLGAAAYLAGADMGWPERLSWLAFYCIMMIAPALALLATRLTTGNRLDAGLQWMNDRIDRLGSSGISWVPALLGLFLAGFGGMRILGL